MGYGIKTQSPSPLSEGAAARERFADACKEIRTLVRERAECEEFLLSWPSDIISLRSFVFADSDSEEQRSRALCDERVVKVNENRDDALRRLGEVAAGFAANDSPAAFVDEAVGKLVEIFFTPKHRS